MDGRRFDTWTRTISSRRTALASLAGVGLALLGRAEAEAHDAAKACQKIRNVRKKRACLKKAKKHALMHRRARCRPRGDAAYCRGLCSPAFDRCGDPVACPCLFPKTCLSNGSCARSCSVTQPVCPTGCTCLGPEVGGGDRCIQAGLSCTVLTQGCATTADCQPGSFCMSAACLEPGGFENRCTPLCAA